MEQVTFSCLVELLEEEYVLLAVGLGVAVGDDSTVALSFEPETLPHPVTPKTMIRVKMNIIIFFI